MDGRITAATKFKHSFPGFWSMAVGFGLVVCASIHERARPAAADRKNTGSE